jgi:hypothetical protein
LFTKQTTLDAVAAGLLWLLIRRPRTGVTVGLSIGALGAAGLATLIVLTGGAFWLNVVSGNANSFDPDQLTGYALNFGLLHCVLLALAAAECVRALRHRQISVWTLYFVTSCLASVGVAKWGAGESYFLAAIATSCVLGACWAARVLENAGAQTRVALSAALLLQAALLSHGTLSDSIGWLPDRGPQGALLGHAPGLADRVEAERLADQIRLLPGPALAEDPSFAVVAGQSVIGNATHLRNLYQAGLWDPTPMVNDLRARRYAIVVLNAELYPEPVLAAIGRFYFLDRAVRINGATYHVFLPGSD